MPHRFSISCHGVFKTYGQHLAVKDLSLQVKTGECFALLGPNGAGKTTTCELLEGIQNPNRGEILILNKSFTKDSLLIRQEIGIQLQDSRLYGKYTVEETLSLFASFYKKSLPISTVLSWLDLESKKNSRLDTLSSGLRQRVYLGIAIIHQPKLIFLDEPTTGLDPVSRLCVWRLLERLKQEGVSIFLTTHHLEEAEHLADRIGILKSGELIAHGSPRELIDKYYPGERLQFSASSELLSDLKKDCPWFQNLKHMESNIYELSSESSGPYLIDLSQRAQRIGVPLAFLQVRPYSLEDVYIRLTQSI